jgi:hypothetical protein
MFGLVDQVLHYCHLIKAHLLLTRLIVAVRENVLVELWWGRQRLCETVLDPAILVEMLDLEG